MEDTKPTLMRRGALRAADPREQARLDAFVPYEYILQWFADRHPKTGVRNRVLVLKAETASGKSTLLPPEIYKQNLTGRGIICTQPRVLTAIQNVNEMVKFNKVMVKGQTIGWMTKYNKLRPTAYSLLSATVGSLMLQLQTMTDNEIIDKYGFIIIDETHERDLQTDMVLFMLKNLLLRNADSPALPFVVLMSATFDPDIFLRYFDLAQDNFIWCTGAAAGRVEMWDWNQGRVVNNYPAAAAQIVGAICRDEPRPTRADVLIFMPGKFQMAWTRGALETVRDELVAEGGAPFQILLVDSDAVKFETVDYRYAMSVPLAEQRVLYGKTPIAGPPNRRVIVATNVAETGLTLPDLKYVIDGGFNNDMEFNPIHRVSGLLTKPAPKSRITQRAGRAGRKFPGVFYPLYPSYIYDMLPASQLPAILTSDVMPIFLTMMSEQKKAKQLAHADDADVFTRADMIDPPSPDSERSALGRLYEIGFVDYADDAVRLNAAGEFAAGLGLEPQYARMVLAAGTWGAPMLDVVAMICIMKMSETPLSLFLEQRNLPPEAYIYSRDMDQKAVWHAAIFSLAFVRQMMGSFSDKSIAATERLQALMLDDIIFGPVLANCILNLCGTSTAPMQAIAGFCFDNSMDPKYVLEFMRLRDEIIDTLLAARIDVFNKSRHGGPILTQCMPQEFPDALVRLKYVLYDGLRYNLLTLRDSDYYTTSGLRTTVSSRWQTHDVRPKHMIYSALVLKLNKKTGVHEARPRLISVLDGFISVDEHYV